MKKSVIELMDEFLQSATPDSFFADCEKVGIFFEEEDTSKEFETREVEEYSGKESTNFQCKENEYCLAA